MARRIYSRKDPQIYQFKEGGNFYFRHGDEEFCLETTDETQAVKNKEFQKSLLSRFGAASFKFRVKDLFPRFLKEKEKVLRPRTLRYYKWLWSFYFEKALGSVRIADMNQRKWMQFCDRTKGVKDFQNHRNLMRQFLAWCESNEFISAVPTLKNPKHKRRRRKIIAPEHMTLIFQWAAKSRGGLLLFLSFLALHGNRRLEVVRIRIKQLDFSRRSLLLSDEDVKTGGGREVPLNPLVMALAAKHINQLQARGIKSPWLFPNRKDSKRHMDESGFKTSWRLTIERAGLEDLGYTWHDFRATYEKWMHKRTDFTTTQKEKMVGASEEVQKRIYVNMDADDLRGLEHVVDVPEITALLETKIGETGMGREKKNLTNLKSRISNGKR